MNEKAHVYEKDSGQGLEKGAYKQEFQDFMERRKKKPSEFKLKNWEAFTILIGIGSGVLGVGYSNFILQLVSLATLFIGVFSYTRRYKKHVNAR